VPGISGGFCVRAPENEPRIKENRTAEVEKRIPSSK
jgi:hypothetical protein